MTFGFAMLVAGTVMLLSGWRNRSITDVLSGVVDPVPGGAGSGFTRNILNNAAGSAVSGAASAVGLAGSHVSSAVGIVPGGGGVGTFDGKPVCNWIIPILKEARRRGWKGTVNSGYRTIEEQRQACIGVCGNPNGCPGTCAPPGQSNHGGCGGGRGAVDVSDHENFFRIMASMGNPLRNALGADDPWHASRSGK